MKHEGRGQGAWMRLGVGLLLGLAVVVLAPACESNTEKIEAFCSEWRHITEENREDCDKMGTEMQTLFEESKGVKLYAAEDEEILKASKACKEAADVLVEKCKDNEKVKEALEMLANE